MGLGEAGVGTAGATVPPLAALHHAGNLQARHHRETSVPHLQGEHVNEPSPNLKGAKKKEKTASHHKSWDDGLLELGLERVHQLLGSGGVKRQHT